MLTITFSEEQHKYACIELPEVNFTSVSTLINMYHEKFDSDTHAKRIAEREGVTKEEILAKWAAENLKAVTRGTKYHLQQEEKLYKNPKTKRHDTHNGFKKAFDIYSLEPGIYPELIVYDIEHEIIGTADYVEIFPDNTFVVRDFKGFPLDTLVPSINGFIKIEDIKVGDFIFDGEGNITKVSGVSQIHYNPCYKIVFDTNEEIVCDHEHKWLVELDRKSEPTVLETEELFKLMPNNSIMRIKNTFIKTEKKELMIDPYVLGCWLGDGNRTCGTITSQNNNMWNEIEKRGYELGEDVSQGGSGKAVTRTVLKLYTSLRILNLLKNKHIPDDYLLASFEQRLDLLRGFMDTDGYFHKKRKRCVMSTTQIWQMEAVRNLVSSLGGKVTVMKQKGKGFGKEVTVYHVIFRLKENPFLTRNEDYCEIMKDVKINKSEHRYIKSIEKVDTVPTKCLEVESPLHTFLVTKNFIPTHNTNKELKLKGFMEFNSVTKTKSEKKMFAPLSHLGDCNFNHYSIQLSTYAYLLEQVGYRLRPNGLTINHILFDNEDNPVDVVDYPVPYLKKEVKALLTHFKKNKKTKKK